MPDGREQPKRVLAEDAEDLQAIRQHQVRIVEIGPEAHKAECITGDEMRRMLDGDQAGGSDPESGRRIWKNASGVTST